MDPNDYQQLATYLPSVADDSETDESLESRVGKLEDEMGDGSFESIETHLEQIETKRDQLQVDLERAIESVREQGEEIAHIDSVRAIRDRLVDLEENISGLRESIGQVVSEKNDT